LTFHSVFSIIYSVCLFVFRVAKNGPNAGVVNRDLDELSDTETQNRQTMFDGCGSEGTG